jgi:hypothetical protein
VALSFAAVLTAGTATAIVNARVLDTTDGPATATNRVLLPSTTTTTTTTPPTTTEPGRVSAAGGAVTAPTVPAPPVTAPVRPVTSPPAAEPTADSTTSTAREVVEVAAGDAGAVTVEVTPTGLRVVGTRPADGWVAEPLDEAPATTGRDAEPPRPRVRFRREDGSWVDWELEIVDGRVVGRERDRREAPRDRAADRDDRGGDDHRRPATQTTAARPAAPPVRPTTPTPAPAPRPPARHADADRPRPDQRPPSVRVDDRRPDRDVRHPRDARGDTDHRGPHRGPGWHDDD